jgi:hypothetical protein
MKNKAEVEEWRGETTKRDKGRYQTKPEFVLFKNGEKEKKDANNLLAIHLFTKQDGKDETKKSRDG